MLDVKIAKLRADVVEAAKACRAALLDDDSRAHCHGLALWAAVDALVACETSPQSFPRPERSFEEGWCRAEKYYGIEHHEEALKIEIEGVDAPEPPSALVAALAGKFDPSDAEPMAYSTCMDNLCEVLGIPESECLRCLDGSH